MAFWESKLNSGISLDAIASGFVTSSEFKAKNSFASGGDFGGGLRMVGEQGMEMEATGPSRIFNSRQVGEMLNKADPELLAELALLRKSNERLEERLENIEKSSKKSAEILTNVSQGGDSLVTKAG
jgi:hypothetical protein